jgi:hypothetical protein
MLAAIAELTGATDPKTQPIVGSDARTSDAAERRQVTVMFSDLVGSTALSTELDPEDMREVIRAYQDACSGPVARYDGFIAKFMGDGVLAYFGFPRAHEDDAERAVRAGLDISAAVKQLRTPTGQQLQAARALACLTAALLRAAPPGLSFPFCVAEGAGQAAAAGIARKLALFFGWGAAVLALDRLERGDGRNVVVVFLGLRALAETYFIGDAEIDGQDIRRIFGSNLYSFGPRGPPSPAGSCDTRLPLPRCRAPVRRPRPSPPAAARTRGARLPSFVLLVPQVLQSIDLRLRQARRSVDRLVQFPALRELNMRKGGDQN